MWRIELADLIGVIGKTIKWELPFLFLENHRVDCRINPLETAGSRNSRRDDCMFSRMVKHLALCLILVGLTAAAAQAQTDETELSNSTCKSRNLTVRSGNSANELVVFQYKGNSSGIPRGLDRSNVRSVAKINEYFGASAVTEDEAVAVVCNRTSTFDEITRFLYGCPDKPVNLGAPIDCSAITEASATISATTGGVVSLGDGASLSIPAGALSQDTRISLFGIPGTAHKDDAILSMIAIQPSGLRLSQPAVLTMRYQTPPGSDPELVFPFVFNESDPPRDLGSELSITEPLGVIARDLGQGTLTTTTTHFSTFFASLFTRAELVMEIPFKRLKKGDILFALSGDCNTGCNWEPGHTGLYLGTRTATDSTNDGKTIVEAISPSVTFNPTDDGRPDTDDGPPDSFTQIGNPSVFAIHYMGARTPFVAITDSQRTSIAGFAIQKAMSAVPYRLIGAIGGPGETCASLVEIAYLSAGIIFPPTALIATPQNEFRASMPVRDIEAKPDRELKVPVKVMAGTINTIPIFGDGYSYKRNPAGASITAAGLPAGSQFVEDNNTWTFSWTPTQTAVGSTVRVDFQATGVVNGGPFFAADFLNIKVIPQCDLNRLEIESITELASSGESPSISPDGSAVVFDRNGAIFRVDADPDGNRTGEQQLTFGSFGSGVSQLNPSWSRDGSFISFTQVVSTTGGIPIIQDADLMQMGPAGGGVTLIQNGNLPDFFFNPDRSSPSGPIVFTSIQSGNGFLSRINQPGDLVQNLTTLSQPDAQFVRPRWNSDGSAIAFDSDNQVFTISASGGAGVLVGDGREPSWSPDNSKLVFSRAGRIVISTTSGGILKDLAAGFEPSWSADGCSIAFSRSPGISLIRFK